MIVVELNNRDFEYDIRSLIKAFYPKEDLKVFLSCEEQNINMDKPLVLEMKFDALEDRFTYSIFKNQNLETEKSINVMMSAMDRKEQKNVLKRLIYQVLCEYTKKKLPWGTLTGIRPTKIPRSYLEEGKHRSEIEEYLRDTYLVNNEKIKLMLDTAELELKILKDIDYENGYSIYIGIPFCPTNCLYCSFTSYSLEKWKPKIQEYLEALFKEIDYVATANKERRLNTIYIGGGTPTTLEPEQLDVLLTRIRDKFDDTYLQELTVEAGRPDSITKEKLKVLKKHRVSRISINPQTMKQKTLDIIGRKHTVSETIEAYHLARSLGFDNINMDLIVGLPEESIDDVNNTMEKIMELDPDSITVHSLALKRASRLNISKDKYETLKVENTQEIIDLTADYANRMSMKPYYLYRQKNMAGNFENVGYAKPGKAGIYNILIMEEIQSIIALGAGASSKIVFPGEDKIERIENLKDVKGYVNRIDEMIERKKKYM